MTSEGQRRHAWTVGVDSSGGRNAAMHAGAEQSIGDSNSKTCGGSRSRTWPRLHATPSTTPAAWSGWVRCIVVPACRFACVLRFRRRWDAWPGRCSRQPERGLRTARGSSPLRHAALSPVRRVSPVASANSSGPPPPSGTGSPCSTCRHAHLPPRFQRPAPALLPNRNRNSCLHLRRSEDMYTKWRRVRSQTETARRRTGAEGSPIA
ncbi:hypothetical protein SORBI_3006G257550 [Sorghum bicolor]|uniref:Uncharacterized protein n=1 Tax=Sorghum bicolor TaxID=4558 RepID=C5Y9G1_SORBI|nr:hypothetical protein SORBI_3006G257550 [Sorghum bicolor]